MTSYQDIAHVYDRLMGHVDYRSWVSGLERVWREMGSTPLNVVDAGCGTGSVLVNLAKKFHVWGIDTSPEMLSICQDKLYEEGLQAVLLEMDIRNITLPIQVDTVICLCDTLNYLLEEEELLKSFQSMFNVLIPGGSLIFDMRTPHYYRDVLGDNQWVQQEDDDVILIWENDFSQTPIMDIDLTFFVKEKSNIFRRFSETHRQRCYEIDHVEELVKSAGFKLKKISGNLSGVQFDPEAHERVYFIAEKTA
ncbi:MAG: class I SAM-dependent methyltransferase [Desulfitobacteriaceae bacterium]|nr:class I SAM-dependent methyltransferase [Desulfitobacteriaceae bacterium]MDD4754030.1 class I SAM-dependent methyltransferase [Desulfitobacteriaceae bacterium]